MNRIRKTWLSALGAFVVAGSAGAAPPDAHEQARRLLQPPAVTAKTVRSADTDRIAPTDAHAQARRLLDSSDVIAEKGDAPNRVAVLAVKAGDIVDAHVQAGRLLASPIEIE